MTDNDARKRRRDVVSAALLAVMVDRVKAEISRMTACGADIEQINSVLPCMIGYYSEWHAMTLETILNDLDEPEPRSSDDDGESLRMH